MKASKKSLHAKLYSFTYTSDFPVNLCPYFWKLVFAFIVFIPNAILQAPSLIFYPDDRSDCKGKRITGMCIYFAIGLLGSILFMFGWFHYHMFLMAIRAYSYNYSAALAGYTVDGITVISLILSYGPKIIRNLFRSKRNVSSSEKHPGIVREFIKAKYNKYCPKIDWE